MTYILRFTFSVIKATLGGSAPNEPSRAFNNTSSSQGVNIGSTVGIKQDANFSQQPLKSQD